MKGEGVVHALRHVHGLLAPNGTLVDMHPVTEEQVEGAGEPVGVIREPEWLSVDLPNSEAALRQVITEGLYEVEAETEYDVLEHFADPDELLDAKRDLLETQDALIDAIRVAPQPLVTRMHVVFRRLRAVK